MAKEKAHHKEHEKKEHHHEKEHKHGAKMAIKHKTAAHKMHKAK